MAGKEAVCLTGWAVKYRAYTWAQVPSNSWACSLARLPGSSELEGGLIPKDTQGQLLAAFTSMTINGHTSLWIRMIYLNVHQNQRWWELRWGPPPYMFKSLTAESVWLPTLGPEPGVEVSMLIKVTSHSAPTAPWLLLQTSWLHSTHRKLGANISMLQRRKVSPSLPVLPQANWYTRHDKVGSHASDVIISF